MRAMKVIEPARGPATDNALSFVDKATLAFDDKATLAIFGSQNLVGGVIFLPLNCHSFEPNLADALTGVASDLRYLASRGAALRARNADDVVRQFRSAVA
jgi:hypothetical protein